jgi:translation elongation factor EF-4
MQVHSFRQHMKAMRSHYTNDVFLKYTLPLEVIDDHNIYDSLKNLLQGNGLFSSDLEMKRVLYDTQEDVRRDLLETQEYITENARKLGEGTSSPDSFKNQMDERRREAKKSLKS